MKKQSKQILAIAVGAMAFGFGASSTLAYTTSETTTVDTSFIGTPVTIDVSSAQATQENVQPIVTDDGAGNYTVSADTTNASDGNIPTNYTVEVLDNSGSQAGWKVQVEATQLTEVGGAGIVLPSGLLSLETPTFTNDDVGASGIGTTYIGQPIDTGSPVTVATASESSGAGLTTIRFDGFNVDLSNAEVYANQQVTDPTNYASGATPYQSTITWSLVSAP